MQVQVSQTLHHDTNADRRIEAINLDHNRLLCLTWTNPLYTHHVYTHLAFNSVSYAWYPNSLLLHVLHELIGLQTCSGNCNS